MGRYINFFIMAIAATVFIILITVWWSNERLVFVGVLGLVMIFGAWRYQDSLVNARENFIGGFYNQKVTLQGVVSKEPDIRSDRIYLTVRAENYSGKLLLTTGRYPEYQYGDILQFSGKVEEPFETEEFSYKNYLSRYDVFAVMRYPDLEKLSEGGGNRAVSRLLAVKHRFQAVLSQILPEPHNALILGLILGLKRSLPEDFKQALITVGVSHIVVISGYNISIITRNLLRTRGFFGRRIAFWLSLLAVLAFVIITGAEASVIRAAIMGLMVVFALNVGRIYYPVNALVFVGGLMVLQNPKILHFDVGFQLSFLATLGLCYLAPIFEKWFAKVPEILGFRSNLASTLAAQAFTLPLLIYHFDRLSLIAVFVNVLVLWVIPYAMFSGFVAAILGLLYLPIGQMVGGLLWVFLEYLIQVVEFFARLPLAAISVHLGAGLLIALYTGLVLWLGWYRRTRRFLQYLEFVSAKL